MLKGLAICAVFLAMMPEPLPGRVPTPSGNRGSYPQSQAKGDQGNSSNAAATFVKDNQAKKDQAGAGQETGTKDQRSVNLTSLPPISIVKEKKTWKDHLYDWGPWVFSLILAVAGGWQLYLLKITWKAIQAQASHMEIQTGILRDSVF